MNGKIGSTARDLRFWIGRKCMSTDLQRILIHLAENNAKQSCAYTAFKGSIGRLCNADK